MLAEQTRDIEHGRHDRAWRLLRRYIGGATGIALVVVPLAWIWMESLIRVIYGARYIGATDAARLMLLAAAVQLDPRLDEVLPGLDREARLAHHRSGDRDRHARAARPRPRQPLRRGRRCRRRLRLVARAGRLLARRAAADARPPACGRGRRRPREGLDRVGDLAAGRRRACQPRARARRLAARARAPGRGGDDRRRAARAAAVSRPLGIAPACRAGSATCARSLSSRRVRVTRTSSTRRA